MRRILLLLLVFGNTLLFAQNKITPCNAIVFVDNTFAGYIDLFDGEETTFPFAKIRNNPKTEEVMLRVRITGRTASRFITTITNYSGESPVVIANVCIKKERLITIAKPLDYPMPLYSSPSSSGVPKESVENAFAYKYHVLDCEGEWLKVLFTDKKGKTISGWMAPEYQCDNIWSSCFGS